MSGVLAVPPTLGVVASTVRRRNNIVGAVCVDMALVTVFAASGRASHREEVLVGLWNTAWPFLVGLAVGWIAARAWRAPIAPARTGVPIWAATVASGMLLRWASDQGVQVSFVLVAGAILLAFLVGWRVIVSLVQARRHR